MTLEEIRGKLKDRNLQAVAKQIGCNAMTLYRLMDNKNISYHNYEKLVKYLTEGGR